MFNTNIKNYTNHKLCFFRPEQVKKGRGTHNYTLKDDNALPHVVIPEGVALSAKNAEGNTFTTYSNGITLKAPSVYTSQLDLPIDAAVTDSTIFVVSREYAAEAIKKNFSFIQRLYVPCGIVYNSKKQRVGCMSLEKAALYPFPSVCMAVDMDIHSKRLAVAHWKACVWQLPAYEQVALTELEKSTIEAQQTVKRYFL